MNQLKWRMAVGLAAGVFGLLALNSASADESGIESLPNRTYIHTDSKVSVKAPTPWLVNPPYRLRRTASSTVLSMEKENPKISITIVWSPLGNRPFSDIIRAAEDEKLGDEYALLQTVYGKEKISRPTTIKAGPYTVFKVLIDDSPDRDGKSVGAVYLFEAGTENNRWMVKLRASFPMFNREQYIREIEEIISTFAGS